MSELSRRAVIAAGIATPFAVRGALAADSYGIIRRVSAGLDALIDPGTLVEQIAYGYYWTEGPVWVKNGGYLLFSDPDKNNIYRWSAAEGASVFITPSGYEEEEPAKAGLREPGANGLAIDASGMLVTCDSGNRALMHIDLAKKKKKIIVDRYDGKRFNSPNDLCIARSGAIYFTDPCYGLEGLENSPVRELPYAGVYRWTPDGQVALIDKSLPRPNGIALSPDEGTLYVSNTGPTQPVITAYQLGADGLPTSSSVFFDTTPMMTPTAKGNVDGLKVDESGNLFATSPSGVLVLSKDARLLGLIGVSARMVSNCAFGEDGSSLFITATDIVARVRLKTRGANT
jgi:gluconolactonase